MRKAHFSSSLILFSGFFITLSTESATIQTDRPDRALLVQSGTIGVRGAVVFHVTGVGVGSPAERAGLKPNDLILAINGRPVYSVDEVRKTILDPLAPPRQSFAIKYSRLNPQTQRYEEATVTAKSEIYQYR